MAMMEDGKTRRIIKIIEEKCTRICNSERCNEFSIKKDRESICKNCKINNLFEKFVGLPVWEFVE